ncbi:MAG: hypothetical protein ACLTKQ_08545 [Acutalibacteraceae bacterium]
MWKGVWSTPAIIAIINGNATGDLDGLVLVKGANTIKFGGTKNPAMLEYVPNWSTPMIEVYSKQNFTGKAALKHNGDMVLTPYSCTVSIELATAIVVEMEHPVDTLGRWKYIAEENVLVVDNHGRNARRS